MQAYRLAVPLLMAVALIGCSKGGGGGNAASNAAAPTAAENAPAAANAAAPAENAPASANTAVPAENAAANTAAPAENAPAADNTAAPSDNSAAAAGGASATNGQQVYQTTCSACHGTGVMGAPKYGNAADWQSRLAQGKNVLYQHAINGIRQMPAKGGNPALTDAQVQAAVDYMLASVSK